MMPDMEIARIMRKAFVEKRFYLVGGMVFCLMLPFSQKAVSVALILWAVLSLFGHKKPASSGALHLLWVPALYLTYIIGMAISQNFSWNILEHKLSLVVFPFIFFLHSYRQDSRNALYRALILGLLLSGVICLGYALYRSIQPGDLGYEFRANVLEGRGFIEAIHYGGNYFFGRFFSLFHQTVYYALYLSAGVAIVLFKPALFSLRKRFFLLGFFLLLLFLIANKAAFIVLLTLFVLHIIVQPLGLKKKILFLLSFLIIAGIFAGVNPRLRNSFERAIFEEWTLKKEARYGFETRFLSWDAALDLIEKEPFSGYGAANAQEALDRKYEEKGYPYPLMERLNAHNQFLQIWIENGILGLLAWTGVLLTLTIKVFSRPRDGYLYTAFLFIIVVNALFESVLNRFSGVSVVAFLLCLMLTAQNHKEIK